MTRPNTDAQDDEPPTWLIDGYTEIGPVADLLNTGGCCAWTAYP
jgi:hypothetical protein